MTRPVAGALVRSDAPVAPLSPGSCLACSATPNGGLFCAGAYCASLGSQDATDLWMDAHPEVMGAPESPWMKVLEGIEFTESLVNVDLDQVLANVRASIRRGHPQVCRQPPNPHQVCLVGGGPSLEDTFDELKQLVFDGAKLVTMNGSFDYCLDRNLQPKAQIVLDARPGNARFVARDVPGCRYYLASQCHPEIWDQVEGRKHVAIYHDAGEQPVKDLLNTYYLGQWEGCPGGTTVGTRAIGLLRALGYLRFHLFGFDSCWMGEAHHAYDQPENNQDKRYRVSTHPSDHAELGREFYCAPWHLKQAEDFLRFIRMNGQHFLLNVHGDGLLAHMLQSSADLSAVEVSPSLDAERATAAV